MTRLHAFLVAGFVAVAILAPAALYGYAAAEYFASQQDAADFEMQIMTTHGARPGHPATE